MGQEILPFLIEVPEAALSDLRRRLLQTRWPEPESVSERGGHFAAFEQPELFVDEIRAFFRLVR